MEMKVATSGGMTNHILCVGQSSSVLMGDGRTQRIDRIEAGDVVLTHSSGRSTILNRAIVDKIGVSIHDDVNRLTFNNGTELDCTPDHPIWVFGKGWCAVSAKTAFTKYRVRCRRLSVGDWCMHMAGNAMQRCRLVSIRRLAGIHEMYVVSAGEDHCFFANGILVHDENVATLAVRKAIARRTELVSFIEH